jgi:hypothetical protein
MDKSKLLEVKHIFYKYGGKKMKILTNTFDYQIGYYPFSIRKMIYYNPLNLLLVSTDNTCRYQ